MQQAVVGGGEVVGKVEGRGVRARPGQCGPTRRR